MCPNNLSCKSNMVNISRKFNQYFLITICILYQQVKANECMFSHKNLHDLYSIPLTKKCLHTTCRKAFDSTIKSGSDK